MLWGDRVFTGAGGAAATTAAAAGADARPAWQAGAWTAAAAKQHAHNAYL